MSKTIFSALAAALVLLTTGLSAQNYDISRLDANGNGIYEQGEVDPNCAYPSGPCTVYCPVTKFKEKKYCVKHCVQEPYTVRKKQCRQVPQYYTKKFCKYVPQYYEKTFCRMCPEYYYTCETKYRNKYVTEDKCCYEPYQCVETRTIDNCVACPQPACPTPACPAPACPAPACPTCPSCR